MLPSTTLLTEDGSVGPSMNGLLKTNHSINRPKPLQRQMSWEFYNTPQPDKKLEHAGKATDVILDILSLPSL